MIFVLLLESLKCQFDCLLYSLYVEVIKRESFQASKEIAFPGPKGMFVHPAYIMDVGSEKK